MVVHHALYAMHSCADVLNLHRNSIQKESCRWFRTAHLITRFKRFQLALFQKITPLCNVCKQQMACCMALYQVYLKVGCLYLHVQFAQFLCV